MDDATRRWLQQKAQAELVEAQVDLARAEEHLTTWMWRQLDPEWNLGFYDPSERLVHYSDLRHDARSKVRFLRAVVRELGGKP